VSMNNILIPMQTDVKYLGLHLDQHLTGAHISKRNVTI
jgi:hypothetical protein